MSASTSLRLVEGADHVLAERVVDRGLAADAGIDLRQQRGRHLDERHAALIRGGGKADHVADDPAAQRDQRRRTLDARAEQCVEDQVERRPVLVRLAVRQHDQLMRDTRRVQRTLHAGRIQWRDDVIADDDRALAPERRGEQISAVDQAATDVDVVGALVKCNSQAAHRLRYSRSS
jgi:hypothetical protein